MKISNSKKQLAKIISENGGWRDGAKWSVQHKHDGRVVFTNMGGKPIFDGCWDGYGTFRDGFVTGKALPNWRQTVLARDEYFHLYPAPDTKLVAMCADVTKENKHPEYCESVMRSIPEPSDKPTIEQLASDYRAKMEIAQQAQEVADFRRGEAEAALSRLIIACADFGFEIKPKGKLEASGASVIDKLQDKATELAGSELNITDWRDLRVGDEVKARCHEGVMVGFVVEMEPDDYSGDRPFRFKPDYSSPRWCTSREFEFIRRP